MANVSPIDGIKYGFELLIYAVAVYAIGFGLFGVGALFADMINIIVGAVIAFVGFLILFAGFAGVQYKIIADGVEKGVIAAK